jgi:SpoVK/Ycf46/Vps4 family AAA+-type ATPase
MTANAIAAMLKKKLLLVNFPRLTQGGDRGSASEGQSAFQSIFREAELSDAIIFFNECDHRAFLQNAARVDQTELLTELERFEGIVFLATNRPYDLDEAM